MKALCGLVLSFLFLAVLACDNGSPTEPAIRVELQTVLKTTLPGATPSPAERTVRDRAGWEAMWSELHGGNATPLPEIDFSREMVVAVLGPGCCGSAEILSIRRGRELVVDALTRTSTNTMCVAPDFSVHVVRLPRFEVPVRFSVTRQSGLCQQ
jgi:hypothetical protein